MRGGEREGEGEGEIGGEERRESLLNVIIRCVE